MSSCPCCDNSLLRHVRHGNVYWFCQSCWSEMPNFDLMRILDSRRKLSQHFSPMGRQEYKQIAGVGLI